MVCGVTPKASLVLEKLLFVNLSRFCSTNRYKLDISFAPNSPNPGANCFSKSSTATLTKLTGEPIFSEIAEAISERAFLNQPVEVVEAVLTGNFDDGQGNTLEVPDRIDFDPYPWQSFANWISSQLVRWDLQGDGLAPKAIPEQGYDTVGKDVFLTDLARELAEELGQNPPSDIYRTEELMFDTFDPADPDTYVQQQIDEYGV